VSAAALVPEAWIEAAGAIAAENEALRWLADLAGLPPGAGGCFVSGGTAGNLSALATARDALGAAGGRVAVGADAHSSVRSALRVLALDALIVPSDDRGRLTGTALGAALAADPHPETVFAVVATAGATNTGSIDDLAGVAAITVERKLWLHVDAAYGGAALCVPGMRPRFAGIEHADSIIIDPHKWLFAPLDCCGLLYREPERARAIHRQSASYLESMHVDGQWDPTDYALHLTRRARGLPFWFSLAVHGTDAYRDAIAATIATTRAAARRIDAAEHVELVVEPELGVLLFRRPGWAEDDYVEWSRRLLASSTLFVLPSRWHGEPVGRFVFLHPHTTLELFDVALAAMA
jgi:aromatic-L-amino-acid decarboxylase